MTPAAKTRALIDEVIWWHNAISQRDDGADYRAITPEHVFGVTRLRHVVLARHDCMRRIKDKRPDWSYPTIGRFFNRDHTTVMYAVGSPERRAKKSLQHQNWMLRDTERSRANRAALHAGNVTQVQA